MNIGIGELIVIVLIVLVLFGAGKIPRLMGDMAKGIKAFRQGMRDEAESKPETPVAHDPAARTAPPRDGNSKDDDTKPAG
ncbi:MAG TPA: twin-arginine translocase TatA/TatE family subunit [Alphaproteobacteria bacterium]